MEIKYSLIPNKLTEDSEDLGARVKDTNAITQEELLEMMNIPSQVTKTE